MFHFSVFITECVNIEFFCFVFVAQNKKLMKMHACCKLLLILGKFYTTARVRIAGEYEEVRESASSIDGFRHCVNRHFYSRSFIHHSNPNVSLNLIFLGISVQPYSQTPLV